MDSDERDQMFEVIVWLTASIAFGAWRQSPWAGLWFAMVWFLVIRWKNE